MIKILGRVEVRNGVRIITNIDICKYYQWFIKRQRPCIKTQLPAYGAHCTLANPSIHNITDLDPVMHYDGVQTELEYTPWIIESPKNFWLPVKCGLYHEIKWLLGFEETKNWLGLHLVICNMKFN